MVKTMLRKLKSRKGESLIESLAAILIFTMASIAMYSMVTAAADINITVKDVEKEYNQQLLVAEQGENSSGEGTVTMVMDGHTLATVPVEIYGAEGELFSYYAKQPAGEGGG